LVHVFSPAYQRSEQGNMVRVVGLVILCVAFLPECSAARNLRRTTRAVAPQILLGTDAWSAKKTQASNSALLNAQTGIARFFYPHFLMKFVSAKKARETQAPQEDTGEATAETSSGSSTTRMLVQLLFGVIYYFMIVSKYPELGAKEASQSAKELLSKNEVMALVDVSPRNCVLSCCCTGPRAAHTFAKTGTMNYWGGLLLMSCFPCCTLMAVNSCTDMNEKMGGSRRNIIMSCLCALCCSCCVVAQDAEALDLTSGVQTGFLRVYEEETKKEETTMEAEETPAEAAKA